MKRLPHRMMHHRMMLMKQLIQTKKHKILTYVDKKKAIFDRLFLFNQALFALS
jgi:hypothetical protein